MNEQYGNQNLTIPDASTGGRFAFGASLDRRQVLRGGVAVMGASLAGGLLAACGSGGSPSSSSSLKPLNPATATGTITVWHYFPAGNTGDTQFLASMTNLFRAKFPHVNVQTEYVAENNFTQKVVAAAGAHIGPDILVYGDDDFGLWVKAGAIGNLAPYFDTFQDRAQFAPSVQVGAGSKLYGVKTYVNLVAMYYNKNVIDQAGITTLPTTLDELDAALGQIAKSSKSLVPYVMCGDPHDSEWVLQHMLTSYGFSYDSPKLADLVPPLELLGSWVSKGYVPKACTNWDQQEAMAQFLVGNVAFVNNGNWRVLDMSSGAAWGPGVQKFPFGIIPLPTGPKGGQIYLGGEWQFLGAFSKNPQLAAAYLENSWLTKKGGELALTDIGSIPARADLASAAGANPLLKPFLTEIKTRGASYPPRAGVLSPLEQMVGSQLSLLLAGQQDGKTTAQNIVTATQNFKP